MDRKRYKPEEIVTTLRPVEVLRGQGATIVDTIHQSVGEAERLPSKRSRRTM